MAKPSSTWVSTPCSSRCRRAVRSPSRPWRKATTRSLATSSAPRTCGAGPRRARGPVAGGGAGAAGTAGAPVKYALSAALGLAFWCGTLDAAAFCLTHGCNDRKQFCEYDRNSCLMTGPLLHWASSCVSFDVQKDGSALRGIGYAQAHDAIVSGFQRWLSADCGAGLNPSISITDYGPVDCRK